MRIRPGQDGLKVEHKDVTPRQLCSHKGLQVGQHKSTCGLERIRTFVQGVLAVAGTVVEASALRKVLLSRVRWGGCPGLSSTPHPTPELS